MFSMFSSPLLLIPPLLLPFHGYSHLFQLGSEAMVEIPPSASSLRGFKVADSVAEASKGPWLSQAGHRAYSAAVATEGPWFSQARHRAYSDAGVSESPWLGRARQLVHDHLKDKGQLAGSSVNQKLLQSFGGRETFAFWKKATFSLFSSFQ